MEQFKNIQSEITDKIVSRIANKIEQLFIEGLKLKGFEFSDKQEFESFIKENCRCEDNIHYKEKVYYVNDIPFFLHNYNVEFSMPLNEDAGFKMTANYGTYKFL